MALKNHLFHLSDSQYNMTLHRLISPTTSCKYSLLHHYDDTFVHKPMLDFHIRLVPRSPFLVVFTLSGYL
jgi:hypothetical protein